jgi:hypothetical protein
MDIMQPCFSEVSHVVCTEVSNALANIVVAIFNVGVIWELACTYRHMEGFVTEIGPGWMVGKQIAQSLHW